MRPTNYLNSSFAKALGESLFGSPDSIKNRSKRQKLYQEMAQAQIEFWNQVQKELSSGGDQIIQSSKGSKVDEALNNFRKKSAEIFSGFEAGQTYASQNGIIEAMSVNAGKSFSKFLSGNDPASQMLQGLFENFWDNFFRLIRKAPGLMVLYNKSTLAKEYLSSTLANSMMSILASAASQTRDSISSLGLAPGPALKSIGTVLSFLDATRISTASATTLAPRICHILGDVLNELDPQMKLLKNSKEIYLVFQVKLMNRIVLIIDDLIQLEKDYQTLSHHISVKGATSEADFLPVYSEEPENSGGINPLDTEKMTIFRDFWRPANLSQAIEKLGELFGMKMPERDFKYLAAIQAIALRQGGIPTGDLYIGSEMPGRAATAFINKVNEQYEALFHALYGFRMIGTHESGMTVNDYLSKYYSENYTFSDPIDDALLKIGPMMHKQIGLSLIDDIRDITGIRISSNLGWDPQYHFEKIIEFTSYYIAEDIERMYIKEFHKRSSSAVISMVSNLCDDVIMNWDYSEPKEIMAQISAITDKAWTAFLAQGDFKDNISAPFQFDDEIILTPVSLDKLDTLAGSQKGIKYYPFKTAAGFKGDHPLNAGDFLFNLLETVTKVLEQMKPVENKKGETPGSQPRSILATWGISREDSFRDLLKEFTTHYLMEGMLTFISEFSTNLITDLKAKFPQVDVRDPEIQDDLSKRFIRFTAMQIQDYHSNYSGGTYKMGAVGFSIAPVLDLDFFRTFFPDTPDNWEIPDSFKKLVFFENLLSSFSTSYENFWAGKVKVRLQRMIFSQADVPQICPPLTAAISVSMRSELLNQIERQKPEIKIMDEYNEGRDYKAGTFDAAFQTLERGILDVVARKNFDNGFEIRNN